MRSSAAEAVVALILPKSRCRQGLSLLIDPQNDFFLIPTLVNVVDAGKLVPETSTEVALRHVYRLSPVQSKLQGPPAGFSVRTASHSACGIVILTVSTLSIAYSRSSACCCLALIVVSRRRSTSTPHHVDVSSRGCCVGPVPS